MEEYIKIFSALADQTRLRIYLLLLEGELCVCELCFSLDLEQSRISHSLRILKEAGIVTGRRLGKWMFYSITENKATSWFAEGLKDHIAIPSADKVRFIQCKNEKMRETKCQYQCKEC